MPYSRAGCVVNSAALFPSSQAESNGRFNSANAGSVRVGPHRHFLRPWSQSDSQMRPLSRTQAPCLSPPAEPLRRFDSAPIKDLDLDDLALSVLEVTRPASDPADRHLSLQDSKAQKNTKRMHSRTEDSGSLPHEKEKDNSSLPHRKRIHVYSFTSFRGRLSEQQVECAESGLYPVKSRI